MVMINNENNEKEFVENVFIKMKSKAIIEHVQKLLFPDFVDKFDDHRQLITVGKNV